jgi:formylglycine-generating enzyme required for sulfatase activity
LKAMALHPVTNVTAYQAKTYCAWISRRLPDTFEWELAARGTEGRPWPWYRRDLPPEDSRNQVLADKGVFISQDYFPEGTGQVGSHPDGATPEGIQDLYGNVWEWTTSTLDLATGAIGTWDGSPQSYLVQRGGAWNASLDRITQIRPSTAEGADADIGFRCVQTTAP